MTKETNKLRWIILTGCIILAALSRLLPHPLNFTPLIAIALFGGAFFSDKRIAMLVPLAALLLSDYFLGFYSMMPVIYGTFAVIVLAGYKLQNNRSFSRITGFALGGSVFFFIVTNFAVWAMGTMYEMNLAGLGTCYIAAIPFFKNTLASSLLYSYGLFYGFSYAEKLAPALRTQTSQA